MPNRVTLLDGAMGSCLWEKTDNQVAAWRYNIENPGIVKSIHAEYIAAGAEIILANTFCANRGNVRGVDFSVEDTVRAGVCLAKEAAAGTGTRVALDVGPLTGLLKPFGDISCEECSEMYREQIGAGMAELPDLIMLETFMDIEMLKLALIEAERFNVPIFCAMSFTKFGKTIMGNTVKKLCEALAPFRVDALGLNCSVGPEITVPIARQFADYTDIPLIFKPNAGVPTEEGAEFDIDTFVADMLPAADFAAYIGGCCGTTPAYIKALGMALSCK